MRIALSIGNHKIKVSVTGNQPTSRSSCTTLDHIPKACLIIPQGYLLTYVHSSLIHNSQNPEPGNNLDVLQPKIGNKKLWYIHTRSITQL